MNTSRPQKRSVTLSGHRTSVSLENAFWQALKHIAQDDKVTLQALMQHIDQTRPHTAGFASAVRVFVLEYYQNKI